MQLLLYQIPPVEPFGDIPEPQWTTPDAVNRRMTPTVIIGPFFHREFVGIDWAVRMSKSNNAIVVIWRKEGPYQFPTNEKTSQYQPS